MKQSVPGEKYWSKAYHLIVDNEYWAKWSFIAKAVYFVLLRHANVNDGLKTYQYRRIAGVPCTTHLIPI